MIQVKITHQPVNRLRGGPLEQPWDSEVRFDWKAKSPLHYLGCAAGGIGKVPALQECNLSTRSARGLQDALPRLGWSEPGLGF